MVNDEEQYFIACFDPTDSSIFFYEFFSNKIISDSNLNKKNIESKTTKEIPEVIDKVIEPINNNDKLSKNPSSNPINIIIKDEKYYKNQLITHFNNIWKKIKNISEFENLNFSSKEVKKKFFKRPFYSKFLNAENLGKSYISTTFPLPNCLSRYEKVTFNIYFHESVSTFSKDVTPLMFQKEVGLFYVTDTLIKESILFLKRKINDKKASEEELISDIDNSEIKSRLNMYLNQSNDNYLKNLNDLIDDPKNKFVFKINLLEDYIFGDIPISHNENIRRKIRERERINLLLMRFDEAELKPNISNFPFIIYVSERQEYYYEALLNFYLNKINYKSDNIIDKSIVFMFKSQQDKSEEINLYTRNNMKRREYLMKYCESGDCDYPFIVSIKSINNLSSIIEHICSDKYEFSNMILLNFKKKNRVKKNILNTLVKKFMPCLTQKKTGKDEDEEEKTKQHEAKMNKSRENDYNIEKTILNDLNFMEFTKNNHEECIMINNKIKLQNFSTIKSLKDYYKCYTDYKRDINSEDVGNNLKKNFYDSIKETYSTPFSKIKQYINFLPTHIVLEVSLVYGLYKIRVFISKGCLIKEDIIINENINFSQFKKIENKKVSSTNTHTPEFDFLYVNHYS